MKNSALPKSKSLVEQAILKTLIYGDVFHFPLTKEEIWEYLISKKKIDQDAFATALHSLKKKDIVYRDGYYCLPGSEVCLTRRQEALPEFANKMILARKAASQLSYIPTILLIGISGGVAVGNVSPEDDVDLFIITKKNTLFMTRLWILAVLEVLQLRRVRNEKNPANKICVNLLIEETALAWPTKKHDLYVAHEIAQMKPLFEREGMYAQFLSANQWIKKFLPNAVSSDHFHTKSVMRRKYYILIMLDYVLRIFALEFFARKVQKYTMKRHQTKEIVQNNFLALHPINYGSQSLRILREKTQLLGLLTKT